MTNAPPPSEWSAPFRSFVTRSWSHWQSGRCGCKVVNTPEGDPVACGAFAIDNSGMCTDHLPPMHQRLRERFFQELARERDDEVRKLPRLQESFPRMPFASPDNEQFLGKLPRPIRAYVERYSPAPGKNLLKLGGTGSGKTSSDVAMVRRVIRDETAELHALTGPEIEQRKMNASTRYYTRSLGWGDDGSDPVEEFSQVAALNWFWSKLHGVEWMSALELALDAKRHPLGKGEPPLVRKAKSAQILFLDDLGQELSVDRDHSVLEVLDARYRDGGSLPTIANSGLTQQAFQDAYGGHIFRRLAGEDSGQLIDVHPKGANG